jgi:alternate signal-mediated exported protein
MSVHTAPRKATSSRKATRAAVAGVLALGLLAAGGGSFANWSDTETVTGGTISSGELTLTVGDGVWKDASGRTATDPSTFTIVPGTVLTYTNTATLKAVGDDLKVSVRTNLPELAAASPADEDLYDALDVTMKVNGETVDADGWDMVVAAKPGVLTPALPVEITIAFPTDSVTGTTAQAQTVDLADLTVVAEQVI